MVRVGRVSRPSSQTDVREEGDTGPGTTRPGGHGRTRPGAQRTETGRRCQTPTTSHPRTRTGRAGCVGRRRAPGGSRRSSAGSSSPSSRSASTPRSSPVRPRSASGDVEREVASALASQTPGPALSQGAYEAVRPSLVLIETDQPEPSGQSGQGLGSGVVVDATGDILTALHVVDGATDDPGHLRRRHEVDRPRWSTSQPENDIAVLRPAELPAGVVPATLGDPRGDAGRRATPSSSATRSACTAR